MYSGLIGDLTHGFSSGLWFVEMRAAIVNVRLVSSVKFRKGSISIGIWSEYKTLSL
jgi:hypothetical protein